MFGVIHLIGIECDPVMRDLPAPATICGAGLAHKGPGSQSYVPILTWQACCGWLWPTTMCGRAISNGYRNAIPFEAVYMLILRAMCTFRPRVRRSIQLLACPAAHCKARDVYEEAIQTVPTVRDFSQVFDAYAEVSHASAVCRG